MVVFATPADVVNHNDQQFGLHLSPQEKTDLVQLLMSLWLGKEYE